MAKSKHTKSITEPAKFCLDASAEMFIDICPRGYVAWTGTTAQLIEEGLVARDFEWPGRDQEKNFTDCGFCYNVIRKRPPWVAAGRQDEAWTNGDYWCLSRSLPDEPNWSRLADIHEAQVNLAKAIFDATPAGYEQAMKGFEAMGDKRFKAFMSIATGSDSSGPARRAA